jgi:hypothetical protein
MRLLKKGLHMPLKNLQQPRPSSTLRKKYKELALYAGKLARMFWGGKDWQQCHAAYPPAKTKPLVSNIPNLGATTPQLLHK